LKILGIETSSPLFSFCLAENNTVLFELKKNRDADKKSRDAQFFSEIQRLVRDVHGFDAIAVSIGPGMFTSLRVGLSLAKGFALAHTMPVVAVNTLDAIGIPLRFMEQYVLAVINAYHEEIYAALYRNGERLSDYVLVTPDTIGDFIRGKTYIVGSGVDVIKKARTALTKDIVFIDDTFLLPDASKIVTLALPRLESGSVDDPEQLEPFYIKQTDAERHYDTTHQVQ
jgi:tRNA threonylcarbamoyladenosine biosynthesis protein TsaB